MNLLQLSAVAQAYYDSLRAPRMPQGWEKYIVTDGHTCMFVHSDYNPQLGEAVFYCVVRNRNVCCQLYKSNLPNGVSIEK